MWSGTSDFNTSKVRLEGGEHHQRNGVAGEFQYLKGAIGSPETLAAVRWCGHISIPQRCDWKAARAAVAARDVDISIPQRCDWKKSPGFPGDSGNFHFNTSKVRLEEGALQQLVHDKVRFQYLEGAIRGPPVASTNCRCAVLRAGSSAHAAFSTLSSRGSVSTPGG